MNLTNVPMMGQTISHYKILAKIGQGGMGVVYKALDLRLDRFAALKFLPPCPHPQDKIRFLEEAKAASAIDHPSICTVYEIDEAPDGRLFIAMAYYRSGELQKRIKAAPLALSDALDVTLQASEGLSAAHQAGIVHRDIKSSNILVREIPEGTPGRIKIIDFGLAQCTHDSTQDETSASGTLAYMSPEQVRGEKVDQSTDIWSLGVVMYEMLTGQLPFKSPHREATMYLIVNADPPPLASTRANIPVGIGEIVKKCLEKNSSARYRSMEELHRDAGIAKSRLVHSNDLTSRQALESALLHPGLSRQIRVSGGTIAGAMHAWW